MNYTTLQEKTQIRIEIRKFLAEHDLKLSQYCRQFGVDYNLTYGNINTYAAIQHDFVNEFVQRLDVGKSLRDVDGKLVITEKYRLDRSVIIIGRDGSGKTTKAREIAARFEENEVVFLNPHDYVYEFCFQPCTEKTQLIVVDDLTQKYFEEWVYLALKPNVHVRKMREESFTINAKFVLICNESVDILHSLTNDFGFISTT